MVLVWHWLQHVGCHFHSRCALPHQEMTSASSCSNISLLRATSPMVFFGPGQIEKTSRQTRLQNCLLCWMWKKSPARRNPRKNLMLEVGVWHPVPLYWISKKTIKVVVGAFRRPYQDHSTFLRRQLLDLYDILCEYHQGGIFLQKCGVSYALSLTGSIGVKSSVVRRS